MKRDMEYVRALLLQIEAHPESSIRESSQLLSDRKNQEQKEKLAYHLQMLTEEAHLLRGHRSDLVTGETFWVELQITWHGHEFIETVRDPEVWSRTVAGAKKAGNLGLDFVIQMAKAYGKHVVKERLGLEL